MSTGFNFKSPAAFVPNKHISLSFEVRHDSLFPVEGYETCLTLVFKEVLHGNSVTTAHRRS